MKPTFRLSICVLALPLALACSRPAAEGQGGPEPFYVSPPQIAQPPFLPPKIEVPRECGDAAITARFAACKAAAGRMEQAACEAAGGTWGRIGLHEGCNCPTGQGGCQCARRGDCLAECVLDMGDRGCPESAAAGKWACSAYHDVVGCFCYLDDKGVMESICAD
jgi:hypothetical protein